MILTRRTKIEHHLGVWLAMLFLTFANSAVQAQAESYVPFQITGTMIQNADGDTFRLQTKEREVLVVRFSGSDSPEVGQTYWRAARNTLRDLLGGKETTVSCYKQDQDARNVCHVTVGATDVGVEMVRRGMAWYAEPSAHELTEAQRLNYQAAQRFAQEKAFGLWSMANPQPPWECRQRRIQKKRCR